MADAPEVNLQNLIVVRTVNREEYMTCTLLPKRDPQTVWKKMAEPGHYTHLFSLNSAAKLADIYPLAPGYNLHRVSMRAPYLFRDGLETLLRTRWLGKAEDTINDEIKELLETIDKCKNDSIRARF